MDLLLMYFWSPCLREPSINACNLDKPGWQLGMANLTIEQMSIRAENQLHMAYNWKNDLFKWLELITTY